MSAVAQGKQGLFGAEWIGDDSNTIMHTAKATLEDYFGDLKVDIVEEYYFLVVRATIEVFVLHYLQILFTTPHAPVKDYMTFGQRLHGDVNILEALAASAVASGLPEGFLDRTIRAAQAVATLGLQTVDAEDMPEIITTVPEMEAAFGDQTITVVKGILRLHALKKDQYERIKDECRDKTGSWGPGHFPKFNVEVHNDNISLKSAAGLMSKFMGKHKST